MSKTIKTDKRRRRVKTTQVDPDAVKKRHSFGSTEKIRRRNRKTWTRLGNKRRRAQDKIEVKVFQPLKCCNTPGCSGLMELYTPGGWYCKTCKHSGGEPTKEDIEYFALGWREPRREET